MLRFIANRLWQSVVTLLAIVAATFFIIRNAPGNPFKSEKAVLPELGLLSGTTGIGERNYWSPDPETLLALQAAGSELEDRIEGIGVGVVAA